MKYDQRFFDARRRVLEALLQRHLRARHRVRCEEPLRIVPQRGVAERARDVHDAVPTWLGVLNYDSQSWCYRAAGLFAAFGPMTYVTTLIRREERQHAARLRFAVRRGLV